eukprot:939510-Prorocentrum_minimum.AAC.2
MQSPMDDPPRNLTCPITLDVMREPVIDAHGNTFEREAIVKALMEKPGVCPLTNTRYPNGKARLTTNRAVKDIIKEYLDKAGATSTVKEPASSNPSCKRPKMLERLQDAT